MSTPRTDDDWRDELERAGILDRRPGRWVRWRARCARWIRSKLR